MNEAWRSRENIDHYYKEEPLTLETAQQFLDSVKSISKVDTKTLEIEKLQTQIDSIKALDQ